MFVLLLGSWYGVEEVTDGGGGGTENKARSWGSVSRIREVMSEVERRALVNILGGGKGRVAIDSEESEICSRWRSRSGIVKGEWKFWGYVNGGVYLRVVISRSRELQTKSRRP